MSAHRNVILCCNPSAHRGGFIFHRVPESIRYNRKEERMRKTFRHLMFEPYDDTRQSAEIEFENGYKMVVTSNPKGLPLFYVWVANYDCLDVPVEKCNRVTYHNCTRNTVDYLMRLVQDDPEKVMSKNC